MGSEKKSERRLMLLSDLATRSSGRHDVKIPLREIAPQLDVKGFAGGTKFVDRTNPLFEGDSEDAYDYNTLFEQGFLKPVYLKSEMGEGGVRHYSDPSVQLTSDGLAAVREFQKSWLSKAIEKQPMTFASVVLSLVDNVNYNSFQRQLFFPVGRYVF